MKGSQILGIILAIALIAFGIGYPTPDKHLRVSGYLSGDWIDTYGEEYVGGDAYNYQMEASLKAGYMGGVLAMKSTSFVGGLLLLFLTFYSRIKCAALEEQTRILSEFAKSTEKHGEILKKISESADGQKAILNTLSATLDKYTSTNNENNTEEELV